MKELEKIVATFLQRHCNISQPVLLGLSGGPDSLALLYLLLQFKEKYPLQLGVAHINHNWRPESKQEADQLKLIAEQHGLPFYLKEIFPNELSGNLEDACRQERLRFFKELCTSHYQAVVLGHHADDQAETVLKRVMEGSNLWNMGSLLPVTHLEGLTIWRPLLSIKKAAIIHWLTQHNAKPFFDRTNLDPKFLRGKFRTQIIPDLEKAFGKQISNNLCHLAKETQDLHAYLSQQIQPYLDRIERGPWGFFIEMDNASSFEIKYLLQVISKREGFYLSREMLESISYLVTSGKANKHIPAGDHIIYIDRGKLFFVHNNTLSSLPPLHQITLGTSTFGQWNVNTQLLEKFPNHQITGWKNAWKGHVEATLPYRDYHLGPPFMRSPYPKQSSISKWWNDHKIPAFLRTQVPVIWEASTIKYEFLTQVRPHNPTTDKWLHIVLKQ